MPGTTAATSARTGLDAPIGADAASAAWVRGLLGGPATRDDALTRLDELLLRAARFEVARRRPSMVDPDADELDELAHEAAAEALVAVLERLDSFRGASRFTTWAAKFALAAAAARLRRLA